MMSLAAASMLACNTAERKSSGSPPSDAPMPCQTDKDCPGLACGPCTPGKVVTEKNSSFDCKMNPCEVAGAVCSAEHICVVRPDAKSRPPRDDAKKK